MTGLASHPSSWEVPRASSASALVTLSSTPYSQHRARTFATVTGTLPVSIRCSVGSEMPSLASATSRRLLPLATRRRVSRRPRGRRTKRCPVIGIFHLPRCPTARTTKTPYRRCNRRHSIGTEPIFRNRRFPPLVQLSGPGRGEIKGRPAPVRPENRRVLTNSAYAAAGRGTAAEPADPEEDQTMLAAALIAGL